MQRGSNLPPSEEWHKAALAWVDAEDAAQMLEETKSAVLSEMINRVLSADTKMSVAKAESQVKGSPEWRRYLEKIVRARTAANRARMERDYMKMRFMEWNNTEANHRAGARV